MGRGWCFGNVMWRLIVAELRISNVVIENQCSNLPTYTNQLNIGDQHFQQISKQLKEVSLFFMQLFY
jgi:hypothetical protein